MNSFIGVVKKPPGVNWEDTIIICRNLRITVTPVPLLCFCRHRNFMIPFVLNNSLICNDYAIKPVEREMSSFGESAKIVQRLFHDFVLVKYRLQNL